LHCHQVKEILNADLQRKGQWTRDLAWRYPLPDNLGIELDVDRGNVIKRIKAGSPASAAGLRAGDVVRQMGVVPIHSCADAQFALDRAAKAGSVAVAWQRGGELRQASLSLPEGWRKTDLTWRPSMRHLVPAPRLFGHDLTAEERKALGLSAKQLAFRQQAPVSTLAQAAGIRAGDVILGVDDRTLEMDVIDFLRYVERNYLAGDRVTVNVLRDGQRLRLGMTLRP
jgi:S1-C subfamily serine protease